MAQHQRLVCPLDDLGIVRRHHDRGAVACEILHRLEKSVCRDHIQLRGRLIGHDENGLSDDRLSERQPLLLASG
jgi:hypothetical protein